MKTPTKCHRRGMLLLFLTLLFVVALNSSCRLQRNHLRSAVTIERQQMLRSRSLMEFPEAVFLKPRLDGANRAEADLAPLIVEQVAESQTRETPHLFGAVAIRRDGTLEVDTEDRVVYTGTALVRMGQPEYRQVIFVWAYPTAEATEAIHWRGVRATIGPDGFPLAWEILSSDTDERHLFVASSLQRAAVEAFGEPVQDRCYALERPVGETPLTVVLRIIEDETDEATREKATWVFTSDRLSGSDERVLEVGVPGAGLKLTAVQADADLQFGAGSVVVGATPVVIS